MLAIDRLSEELRRLPALARAGLAVLAFGAFADVIAHLSVLDEQAASGSTASQLWAHTVTFVGMFLVLLGAVVDGVRKATARRASAGQGDKGGR